jgi:hypothetical protein
MQTFDITKEEYISVLETEMDTLLLRQYYNPEIEGTLIFTVIDALEAV